MRSRLVRRGESYIVNLSSRIPGVIPLLGLVLLVLAFFAPEFVTVSNAYNIVCQGAALAIASFGMTLAILMGGIDLSIGSVIGLSGVVAGILLRGGLATPFQVVGGVVAGGLCGIINGFLISYVGLPPFVATFGMMGMAHGLALVLTEGRVIWGFSPSFRKLADGSLLSAPIPLWVTIGLCIALYFMLRKTSYGVSLYAIGGNEEAAALSGVPVKRNKLIAYSLSGVLAGIAGILMASRMNSAMAIAGAGSEFDAIAATVVGGTSLAGGRGGVGSTLIGAVFISALRNGMNLVGLGTYWQVVAIGAMIIVAFLLEKLKA